MGYPGRSGLDLNLVLCLSGMHHLILSRPLLSPPSVLNLQAGPRTLASLKMSAWSARSVLNLLWVSDADDKLDAGLNPNVLQPIPMIKKNKSSVPTET